MAPGALPPGFRFHPTDEELVAYYLKRKINGHQIELGIITEIDLYQFEPWELPSKSLLASNDLEWYFFSPRDKKYANGSRTNRATNGGYWKSTGKDREVYSEMRVVGMKKTLVYYQGRAPNGLRTDWVMHEYRLALAECQIPSGLQNAYALCRVFRKAGTNDVASSSSSQANIIPMPYEQSSNNMDINSTEAKCDDFESFDLSSILIGESSTNLNNQGSSSTPPPGDAAGDIDWSQYLNDEELSAIIDDI